MDIQAFIEIKQTALYLSNKEIVNSLTYLN